MKYEITVDNTVYLMTDAEGGVYFSRKDGNVLLKPDFDAAIEATIKYSMMNPQKGCFNIQTYLGDIGKVTQIFIPYSDGSIVIELSDDDPLQAALEVLKSILDEDGIESFLPPQPVKKPSLVERLLATWRRFWGWLETW